MYSLALVACVVAVSHCALAGKVCPRPPEVLFATIDVNKNVYEVGEEIEYTCRPGFIPNNGQRKYTCLPTGKWPLNTLLCLPKRCPSPGPLQHGKMDFLDLHYQSSLSFSCDPGYKLVGTRTSQCMADGKWSGTFPRCERTCLNTKETVCPYSYKERFLCIAQNCMYSYSEASYSAVQKMIRRNQEEPSRFCFRCMDSSFRKTQFKGLYKRPGSGMLFTAEAVTCAPPSLPEFGVLSYRRLTPGNISHFLDTIIFECVPPLALIGNETATCMANGNWSSIPECKVVTCPTPTGIENGFIEFAVRRTYHYNESVSFGCQSSYVLDGPKHSRCEKDGNWSTKPTCKGPCKIPVKKAVVLYNGEKKRVQNDLKEGIQHGETISFFCKNKEKSCAYTVAVPCVDGNLTLPACFKERGFFSSLVKKDPSDMKPCEDQE